MSTNYPDITLAVQSFLLADPDVIGWAGSRVYARRQPQGVTGPSVVFWVVGATPYVDMQGRTGLSQDRLQFDAMGENHEEAYQLGMAVSVAMDNIWGKVIDRVWIQGSVPATGL